MRVFSAGLLTETNTFAPMPTGMRGFETTVLVRGGRFPEPTGVWEEPNVVWGRMAAARGWTVVQGLCAGAQPAGNTLKAVYETLRDELLADLKQALPVDMVLLNLHGAMVADGYDDCEGDILERVRAIVGPDVPVGCELDLHCHLTERMTANATAIVIYKEYPHIDVGARAAELFDLIADAAAGRTRPVHAVYDCRMMGLFATPPEPLRGFVDRMSALEGKDGVLSVSLGHGFPWGDVADAGMKVLVVTDGRPKEGAAMAERLGREIWDLRDRIMIRTTPMEEAFRAAAARNRGPVVIADSSDNTGGGWPGDSTTMLRYMVQHGIRESGVAAFWDPIAVDICFEAGEGATLDLRIGGKTGPVSDLPIDLRVTVKALKRGLTQRFGGVMDPMGDAALVHHDGIDIVLITARTQVYGLECFETLGVDPKTLKVIVVKSSQHFYAAYGPIAEDVLYVVAPGLGPPRFEGLSFKKLRRPKWPMDADPFAAR